MMASPLNTGDFSLRDRFDDSIADQSVLKERFHKYFQEEVTGMPALLIGYMHASKPG